MTARVPHFRALSDDECRALLAKHHAGRLAFSFHDRVDIEPISYAMVDDWLYARTSPGTKLAKLTHNPWVAFEVDKTTGVFDWQSVVIHGTAYFITSGAHDAPLHAEAVKALQTIDPRALTHDDLAPDRTVLFRIHIDSLVGRAASTK